MLRAIIAGGGASGALLAVRLVSRCDELAVTIVEPREHLGCGTAYATDCALHLLNVPAGKISAFPDEPDHFVRWLHLATPEPYDARSFVPRRLFGAYLRAIVAAAQSRAGDRFNHVRDVACGAHVERSAVRVQLGNAQSIDGDFLVLAIGNPAPASWPSITSEVVASGRFFGSAWEPEALAPADADETVLLLGTGLTAVDAVLGLRANGHRGAIAMLSRRGLLPHEHRVFDTPPPVAPEAKSIRDLIGAIRSEPNWRLAVDGVRPTTNAFWQALSVAEQRRFVRHVLPYWNVHRHRMAPQVARELAELVAAKILRMVAGRTGPISVLEDGLRVPITLRGTEETLTIDTARVINCSGPEHDVRKLPNPLVRSLLADGTIAPHELGIGLRVGPDGALIDRDGRASDRLFAIGPVRFGTLIETTAIPEIRMQAAELATTLLGDPFVRATA